MDQDTINYLVECAKQGSDDAFAQLYDAAYGMVYHVCLGYLNNHEDAEDTTQEVFIKIYNSLNTLTDNRTFFGWAQTTAIHKSIDKLRSRKVDISFEESVGIEDALFGDDRMEFLPDTYVMQEEQRRIMENILVQELTDVQYQTVYMFYYNNLPVEQIAQVMAVPVGTVKTRLMNSRIKIKEGVQKYENATNDKITVAGAFPSIGMVLAGAIANTPINYVPFAGGAAMAIGTTAGVGITSALLTKIIIGVSAVGILGVGTAVAVNHNNKKAENEANTTVTTVMESEVLAINTDNVVPVINADESDFAPVTSKSYTLQSFTFLGTDEGDVYCFDGGDNKWNVDNKDGSCYPLKYFTPTYTDTSRIDISFDFSADSRTDLFYYGILDSNDEYLYVSDYGETTVTINESRIPSIYSDGKIKAGQYVLELYYGEDIIWKNIVINVKNGNSIPEGELNLTPEYRELVNCIKNQATTGNYTDLGYEHPGINYFLNNHPGKVDSIKVAALDITGNGVPELFFMYETEDGVPYILEMYEMKNGKPTIFCSSLNLVYYYLPGNTILMTDGTINSLYSYWTGNASGEGFYEKYAVWGSTDKLPCATEDADYYWYSATNLYSNDAIYQGSERPTSMIAWDPAWVPAQLVSLPNA